MRCKYCGEEFVPVTSLQSLCSKQCSDLYYNRPKHGQICQVCGKHFKPVLKEQKYCSFECEQKFLNSILVCKHCGRSFNSVSKRNYCSDRCKNAAKVNRTGAQAAKKVVQDKHRICKWCQSRFYSETPVSYCSDKCRQECASSSKKTMREGMIRVCRLCRNTFVSPTYRKYCSKECRSEAQKKHRQLKDIYVPADIKESTEKMRIKFGDRIISTWLISGFNKRLKDAIIERDGYRCYICGKETNLHVHHIIPREQGGPHIPENLVTLCSGCHRSVESGNVEKAIRNCVRRAIKNSRHPEKQVINQNNVENNDTNKC